MSTFSYLRSNNLAVRLSAARRNRISAKSYLGMSHHIHDAVGQALTVARPQIGNTDQGSSFTSPQRTTIIAETGAQRCLTKRW